MKNYTITPKGQVTIPVEVREKLKIKPGDKIAYEDTTRGILVKAIKRDILADFGFLKKKKKSNQDLAIVRKATRGKIAARRHSR